MPTAKKKAEWIARLSFLRVSQKLTPSLRRPCPPLLGYLQATAKMTVAIAAAAEPVETAFMIPQARRRKNLAAETAFFPCGL
jgi:hypothetical protein